MLLIPLRHEYTFDGPICVTSIDVRFLSEMMAFTGRQEDRYGQWLQAALEGQMEPWPSEIAWYFNRMPSQVPRKKPRYELF